MQPRESVNLDQLHNDLDDLVNSTNPEIRQLSHVVSLLVAYVDVAKTIPPPAADAPAADGSIFPPTGGEA